jgi:hypothetical protein
VGDATDEPSAPPSPASPPPSLAGSSSPTPTRAPAGGPSCLLWQSHGNLVAENGRPVFRSIQHDIPPDPVPLDLPGGWEIRAKDGGQFEVVDRTGAVRATTGTRVIVLSDADQNTPLLNADGALVVCQIDSYPTDLEVEEAP